MCATHGMGHGRLSRVGGTANAQRGHALYVISLIMTLSDLASQSACDPQYSPRILYHSPHAAYHFWLSVLEGQSFFADSSIKMVVQV